MCAEELELPQLHNQTLVNIDFVAEDSSLFVAVLVSTIIATEPASSIYSLLFVSLIISSG